MKLSFQLLEQGSVVSPLLQKKKTETRKEFLKRVTNMSVFGKNVTDIVTEPQSNLIRRPL
jgi:hypothetical protein